MVFKAKDARTYKLKVAIPTRHNGKSRTFSTGTTAKAVADDVERTVDRWKARRVWAPLEAVFDGLVTLAQVYDAEVRGALDALLTDLRDVDLDPLVTEWAARANAKYVRQVRLLVIEGERFPASWFRRKRVSEFLAELTCAAPTKNRYRAALSVFAKWLVEREVLDANPVRDVAMYKERDPRMTWMTWLDAQRVAMAAPRPYRVLFALMAASGIELGAALKLARADVDLNAATLHARGSKTSWRNRVVRYEPHAAILIETHCLGLVGAAPLFAEIEGDIALDAFKAAQKAVGISGHRLHDLRHTYAVNALRKGYKAHVVARQLGHKDATMVTKVYGRFIPDASDYVVTNLATKTSPKARGARA
jgi:integrase